MRSTRRLRPLIWTFVGVIVLLVGYIERDKEIDSLAKQSLLTDWPHSKAIDQLARYRGGHATAALLSVAKNRRTDSSNVEAAMLAVSTRGNDEVTTAFAEMLRPDLELGLRKIVVNTLSRRECNSQCMDYVLQYLERRFWGEKTVEDNLVPNINPSGAEVDQQLYSILLKRQSELKMLLAEHYGMRWGSLAPSPFGIAFVSRTGMESACPVLQSSIASLNELHAENITLLNQLRIAKSQLKCNDGK